MNKKWLLSLSLLLLVFIIAACSGEDDAAEGNEEDSDTSEQESEGESETIPGAGGEQPEMPEPDLEGTPDIVAEVNGEEITKEEFESTYTAQFQQAMMQAQMSGQEVDQEELKGQIAEGMIGQKLIIQEAEKGDFEASEEDINETLDMLAQQNGLESADAFITALGEQGMEEEEVMSQVELQVKVDKLIASKSEDSDPTDEELQEMYEQFTAQMEEMNGEDGEEVDIPSFEDMEADLIARVEAEKESEAYQTLIEELQADADITNNL
jgi:peptidyl-prolyl cis-trans isomerase SurA